MAFNPFAGFAKYKRFWMGAVMILVMITFVLCSGTKGDMGDILLRVFRFGGTAVVSIDGKTYYRQDFDKLIKQRKVASDYMRIYARLSIDLINERVRNLAESKDEDAKQKIQQYAFVRQLLTLRTKDPKFFETGTKADELVDFRVWLAEADRLKINFSTDYLFAMIDAELYKRALTEMNLQQLEAKVMQEVRQAHGYDVVSADFVLKALENEFRVRIAKLADSEYQIRTLGHQQINPYKRIASDPFLPAITKRTPISPAQLWEFYQENRKEFDAALLPLPVAEFTEGLGEPDPKKLQDLFDKHKKTSFDPASDAPGFRRPQQVRIQYVTADKNSPFFKQIASTADIMGQYPIGSFVPQYPLATALTFAAGPAMFDAMLQQDYYVKVSNEFRSRVEYFGGSNFASDHGQASAAFLARRNPIAITSMVGNCLHASSLGSFRIDAPVMAIPAFLATPYTKNLDAIKAARKSEARVLAPWFATAIASGTMRPGFVTLTQLEALAQYPTRNLDITRPLPLAIVRDDILKEHDERISGKFVAANMAFLKKKLEDDIIAGKASQVQRLLDRYGPRKKGEAREEGFRDLGLEIAQTEKFYDRYSIKNAPELKPLLEAYERYLTTVNMTEGRELRPESILKDDDFWKLFFDGSETFSAARGKYEAKPWPPVIKLGNPAQIEQMLKQGQNLDIDPQLLGDIARQSQNRDANKDIAFNLFSTSDRPFLFWKTEEKVAEVPESLAEVKDKVAEAWKMQQARETKVLPYAKKLAESLLAGNSDYASILKQDPKFGKTIINLERLAPLYFDRQHFGGGKYSDYKLKRGLVSHPREDMVAQLLALNDMKKPIKSDIADLDRLNEDLYNDAISKKVTPDRFVQILTNKPRDTYYVAVVALNRPANTNEYFLGVMPGAAMLQDMLFDRAAEKIGAEHYRTLVQQLRKDHRVVPYDGLKSLDNEGGGGGQ